MEERCYTLYVHVCPNDKNYIGITKNTPERRWGNGKHYKNCILFNRAIKKYGWNNIKHIIVLTNLTKEEAENKEQSLISFLKSNNPNYGYNIANGGYVNSVSDLTKEKLRKISTGKTHKVSDEIKEILRNKNLGENNPMFGKIPWNKGKKMNEKICQKMSAIKKGKISPKRKKVLCIEKNKIYNSIAEAEMLTGIKNISRCCLGNTKKAGGYHWQYYEINKEINKKGEEK